MSEKQYDATTRGTALLCLDNYEWWRTRATTAENDQFGDGYKAGMVKAYSLVLEHLTGCRVANLEQIVKLIGLDADLGAAITDGDQRDGASASRHCNAGDCDEWEIASDYQAAFSYACGYFD